MCLGILNLSVLLMNTLLFAHFFACMFHFIGLHSQESKTWISMNKFNKKSVQDLYLYSLYWSTVTMMTVGYGDIVPQNSSEILFTVITIFVGCIIVGYNINKIGNIFQDMNKDGEKIQENINKINTFMDSKAINGNLQMRIRAYLNFIWQKQNEKLNKEVLNIIDSLSDSLKEELYLEGYGDIIRNYPVLSDNFSYDFLSYLIRSMQEQTFMKNDLIFKEDELSKSNLYFIISGEIEIFRSILENNPPIILKKLKEKENFGEFCFFTGFQQMYSARASTYTQVYKISRENFLDILNKFPLDYEKYSEIKDKIILYRNYECYNLRCIICNQRDHMNHKCPLMHYVPNKENIILRYLYSEDQERKPCKRRKMKNFNSLIDKLKIAKNIKAMKLCFRKKYETSNEDSLSQEEENEERKNFEKKIDLRKKKTFLDHKPFIKLKEIEADSPIQSPKEGKLSPNHLNSFFYVDNIKKTKKNSSFSLNQESNFELNKTFLNYFPEGNFRNFVGKLQMNKNIRESPIKKKREILEVENLKNFPKKIKPGYSFLKTCNFDGSEKIEREKNFQSDSEMDKEKVSFISNFSRFSRTNTFFKKETKKTNFTELVNELKQQKYQNKK